MAAQDKAHSRRDRVLVVALQSGKQADGGLESLTQIVGRYSTTSVHLITQLESDKTARWRAMGHRVTLLPLPYAPGGRAGTGLRSRLISLRSHLRWNLSIAWICRQEQATAIHVNDPHALWHSAFAAFLAGIPVLFNIRDTKPRVSSLERWKWRLAFSLSRCQVVLSQEMRDFWHDVVTPWIQPRLVPVYSIVDPLVHHPLVATERAALRAALQLEDGRLHLGYIASFSPKKAQLELLRALAVRRDLLPARFMLHFVGDFSPETDEYAAACLQVVSENGLSERVRFVGYRKDVHRWYPALDLVVVATLNEGLARCMIESLAAGTPVLSFAVCSAREILAPARGQEACGAVVAQGDYRGLIEAINAAEKNPLQVERWSSVAERRAPLLFPPRNAHHYESLYQFIST